MQRCQRQPGGRVQLGLTLGVVSVALVVAAGGWWVGRRWLQSYDLGIELRLPPQMGIERVVANLSARFGHGAVVAEEAGSPVRIGRLEPGFEWRVAGRGRQAIVTSPSSELRFNVAVPSEAQLRFGIAVEGDGKRDRHARGIRFEVSVGGRRAFSRVINPARTRHDRRWFDASIDLEPSGDRDATISLRTTPAEASGQLAGTPGWSHVRIVQERLVERQPASSATPNVLVLLVDTLRADRLGCYGAIPSPSPTTDLFATTGLLFERVAAQSAWTLPSVATLFTGLHPRSHGVIGFAEDPVAPGSRASAETERDPAYLSDQLETLAERAQAAGITTIGISANPLVTRGTNLARGFETFVEFGLEGSPPAWQPAARLNDIFLDWLSENRSHRFLGYLHFMDVHDPYDPPAPYRPAPPPDVGPRIADGHIHHIAERINRGDARALTDVELAHLRALYDGQISYWDAELSRLLDGLTSLGLDESTVVILTADHGEEFLEHGRLKHGAHLYDELISVPLLIRGPGLEPAVITEQAQGIDLLPTVAGLLGLSLPRSLPGRNLLESREERPAISETRFGATRDGTRTELISLRTDAWKLIHSPARGQFELYDLRRDPDEQENRFGTAPVGPELVRELEAWRAAAPPAPRGAGRDPAFQDKLRALGYLE